MEAMVTLASVKVKEYWNAHTEAKNSRWPPNSKEQDPITSDDDLFDDEDFERPTRQHYYYTDES